MQLVIVSGISGSGKTLTLHALEDLEFYCIDNLPVFMLEQFIVTLESREDALFTRTAIGIDSRSSAGDLNLLPEIVKNLRARGIACEVMFLDAATDVLIRRFSETRRRHPLALSGASNVQALINQEKELLQKILLIADIRIDTSRYNVHQLRDRIHQLMAPNGQQCMQIVLQSFGFKNGTPLDADFMFDVRCLPNPYWQNDLRSCSGLDLQVQDYLAGYPEVQQMHQDILNFILSWIPKFEADGRFYLTIAIGCTGGRHRSVYIVEKLQQALSAQGACISIRHRDLT